MVVDSTRVRRNETQAFGALHGHGLLSDPTQRPRRNLIVGVVVAQVVRRHVLAPAELLDVVLAGSVPRRTPEKLLALVA